ncbi:hypothetical protein LJB83_01120 [Clostridia bacterium OttesenSCG-928-F22]|nr:hypothetical protein [Clostridia bacterium OttesenSCG-928-F22]
MRSKILVVLFALTLGTLSIGNLFAPKRAFSEHENRYLAQMPALNGKSILDGSFSAGFEEYITDQFLFRDSWVQLKTAAEQALQKLDSGGVYLAKDGYLIEMFDSYDEAEYEKQLAYLHTFERNVAQRLGVPVSIMLVPTASYALADKLPANTPEADQSAMLTKAASMLSSFIDVSSALLQHNGEYIYYRTDHHWTSLGAFYAYSQYCTHTGLSTPSLEEYQAETLSTQFLGTTYSKVGLYSTSPDTITGYLPQNAPIISVEYNLGQTTSNSIFERSYLQTKDKYSAFFNANQSVTRAISTGNAGGKLLIIKDSYANTFAQFPLKDYQEVHMLDLRYYKLSVYDYIEQNGITDVLVLYNLKGLQTDKTLHALAQ